MKLYDVLGASLMMESVNVLSDHCQLPALRLQPRLQLSQSLRMYIFGRVYTHVYIYMYVFVSAGFHTGFLLGMGNSCPSSV